MRFWLHCRSEGIAAARDVEILSARCANMLIVFCPNCRIPVRDERCPQCGAEMNPASAEESSSIEFSAADPAVSHPPSGDWKQEVRRRLEVHARKKGGVGEESGSEDEAVSSSDVSDQGAPGGESPAEGRIERPLVVRSDAGSSGARIVTFSEKASLSDLPVASGMWIGLEEAQAPEGHPEEFDPDAVSDRSREEDELDDEAPPGGADWGGEAMDDPEDAFPADSEEEPQIVWVSREIFLSRVLAGLVDFIWPAFAGGIFAYAAAYFMGHVFFTTVSAWIAAVVGGLLYVFGCTFFLTMAGQTPGMQLASLRLLHNESEEIPLWPALVRVVVLLPVTATLAGLLWGLFDPLGRCLHDRLSSTRVVIYAPPRHPSLSMLD